MRAWISFRLVSSFAITLLSVSCRTAVMSAAQKWTPPSPTSLDRAALASVHESASGYFVYDAPAGFEKHKGAWLRVAAEVSDLDLEFGKATLERVYVHGLSGKKDLPQLLKAPLLATLDVVGNSYESKWIQDESWTSDSTYSLLEIYDFRYATAGTSRLLREERVRQFTGIEKGKTTSVVVLGNFKEFKDASATITCAGSFFNGQGLAMYDVTVQFMNVSTGDEPVHVQVFAGPTEATATLLHDESLPLAAYKSGHYWEGGHRIVGDYGGEQTRYLRVIVTYSKPGSSDTNNLFEFSSLDTQHGVQIPGPVVR